MKELNQQGASSFLLTFVIVLVLFLGAGVFGFWAFQGRQDYKNHVDAKVSIAVQAAQDAQGKVDQQKYDELEKQPLTTYKGPEAYGSILVSYPKTWSSYVDTSGNSGSSQGVVDGYFYPGTVPSINGKDSVFALRLEVLDSAYSQVLGGLNGQQTPPKIAPYSLPKVSNVVGVRVTGTIGNNKTGDMIVLPLRDKTLEFWTEGTQFENDFNNYVLPNLTFSP